jgi:hypothetical protein
MDLRRSVLSRKSSNSILINSKSNNSNSSMISNYDTADESGDNSLYFSFSSDIEKSANGSSISSIGNISSISMDKENTTVIENVSSNILILESAKKALVQKECQDELKLKVLESKDSEENKISTVKEDYVIETNPENPVESKKDVETKQIEEINYENTLDCNVEMETESSCQTNNSEKIATNFENQGELPTITVLHDDSIEITDPNKNLINPFLQSTPTPPKKSIRRSSIVSTQHHYFSPIVRRSIDNKKASTKPVPTRRTIFSSTPSVTKTQNQIFNSKPPVPKPRQQAQLAKSIVNNPTTSKAIQNQNPSKVQGKVQTKVQTNIKPKIQKTQPFKNPPVKVSTSTKVPDPKVNLIKKTKIDNSELVKDPKPPAKRKSSPTKNNTEVQKKVPKLSQVTTQPCKYCGKKFKETAFLHHWAENCTQIPIHEKRKIIGKREVETQKRRTTIFLAPPPKMNKSMNKTLNKSGIKITPKKSLKCHLCNKILSDAFELAKHVISHKFGLDKEVTKQE